MRNVQYGVQGRLEVPYPVAFRTAPSYMGYNGNSTQETQIECRHSQNHYLSYLCSHTLLFSTVLQILVGDAIACISTKPLEVTSDWPISRRDLTADSVALI